MRYRLQHLRHFLFLMLLLTVAQPLKAAFEDPTAEDLIQAYERSLSPFRKVTFRLHERVYAVAGWERYGGEKVPDGTMTRDAACHYWREGKRWKVWESSERLAWLKGTASMRKVAHETIYPAKGQMNIILDEQGRKAEGMLVNPNELTEEESLAIGIVSGAFCLPGVDGRMSGLLDSLPETLRASRASAKRAQLEGKDVWLLECTGPRSGQLSAWLDPSHGFLPLRVVVLKQNNEDYVEATDQFDATKFSFVGDHPVISDCVATSETLKKDGTREITRVTGTFSEINFNPDFSTDPFTPSVPIPDGFPVTVPGEESIAYEWQGGRVVKSVSQSALANLQGNVFHSMSALRRWFWPAVVLLVIGVGVLWFRRRFRKGGTHV